MSLGEEIRNKRKEKKLTQFDLADKIGLCRNYISDIENDRYNPSLKTLVKISKVLDLDINFLLKELEIQDN